MPRLWAGFWKAGRRGGESHDLQSGLWHIGNQACHILVHDSRSPGGKRPQHGEQLVVLIPQSGTREAPQARRVKNHHAQIRLSPVIEDTSIDRVSRLDVTSDEAELDLWDSRFMLRGDHDPDPSFKQSRWGPRGWCKPSCIPISIILVLIVLVVLLPLLDHQGLHHKSPIAANICHNDMCMISLVESIPQGMEFPTGSTPHPSTDQTWLNLLSIAQNSIEIASFYWTLQSTEVYPDPSSIKGEKVFQELLQAGTERNITIHIAQNSPTVTSANNDTDYLSKMGAAEVRSVNFTRLMGTGVLHTKLWIVDRQHIYIGSANMDWRSLTQVKELGVVIYNCSCLAADLGKIFDVYWFLGTETAEIPGEWSDLLDTAYNHLHPMGITFNGSNALTFAGSSPPPFCPDGRSTDLQTILHIIETAEKFISIAVMDYFPLTIYTPKAKFWPDIDDALRAAAIDRHVKIKLLVSKWNHTRNSMNYFLRSLSSLSKAYRNVDIQVKYFEVISTPEQAKIPFARVNHNKYMVTDNTAYIGTSNWSGDYFISTGGVGFAVVESSPNTTSSHYQSGLRDQLQGIFDRDWNSQYSHPIPSQ